jgi:hypothetical protein
VTVNLERAAELAGISDGLLILWIATGNFKPSIELAGTIPGENTPAFGWNRFLFEEDDIDKLRTLAEETAERKSKAEAKHVKGSHYSVQELASVWGLGVDKIRELFENEPDVIKLTKPTKKGRRSYVTLRIPENVAARVQRRNS